MSHPHRFSIRSSVNPSELVFSASTNRKQPYGLTTEKKNLENTFVLLLGYWGTHWFFLVFLLSGCCPKDRWSECDFACELAHDAEDAGTASETESPPERRIFKVLFSLAFQGFPLCRGKERFFGRAIM